MFNGIIQGIGIVEDLNLKKNNFLKIKTKFEKKMLHLGLKNLFNQ